jgi:hypothetical protein
MAKFLVTVRDVRPFNHQYGTSGYYTFIGTVQSIARYLAENQHEVLINSLLLDEDAEKVLLEVGYQEKT